MYRASDGYPLVYRHWRTAGPPRTIIVALHGIQSHGGWYTHSCRRLAEAGHEVFFLDRRGSGLNRPQRGHAIHSERLLNDILQFLRGLRWERRFEPATPIVLSGVSWGGKLATAFAAKHPAEIDGLALLYPGIHARFHPSIWQRWRLAWASAAGWGHLTAPIPLNDPALFTGEPEWQDFIRRDELALMRVSVDFLRANLQLNEVIARDVHHIRCPVLMMLAGRDDIIDNTANRRTFERMTTASRRLREYPEARHTLEFERNRDEFVNDLLRWLDEFAVGREAYAFTPTRMRESGRCPPAEKEPPPCVEIASSAS